MLSYSNIQFISTSRKRCTRKRSLCVVFVIYWLYLFFVDNRGKLVKQEKMKKNLTFIIVFLAIGSFIL